MISPGMKLSCLSLCQAGTDRQSNCKVNCSCWTSAGFTRSLEGSAGEGRGGVGKLEFRGWLTDCKLS